MSFGQIGYSNLRKCELTGNFCGCGFGGICAEERRRVYERAALTARAPASAHGQAETLKAVEAVKTVLERIERLLTEMKKIGTPIGSYEDIKNAAGKTLIKPKVKRKAASEHIRQRKSKKVTVRRRTV